MNNKPSHKFSFTFFILLVFIKANSQNTFEKAYRGSGFDVDYWGSSMQTSDGGFIIAQITNLSGAGAGEIYLVKTDSLGQLQWSKICGDPTGTESVYKILQTNDGSYIIAGRSTSFGSGDQEIYLLKVDSIGNFLWSKIYNNNYSNNSIWDCQITNDGGLILVGETRAFCSGGSSTNGAPYIIKTDGNGNIQWDKIFCPDNSNLTFIGAIGLSIVQTSDGGYIISGQGVFSSNIDADPFLMKTDSLGTIQWFKHYNFFNFFAVGEDEWGWQVKPTYDGGYVMAVHMCAYCTPSYKEDLGILKVDSTGTAQWAKRIEGWGLERAYSVEQACDSGYVISGWVTNPLGGIYYGQPSASLVKFDKTGIVEWQKKYNKCSSSLSTCINLTKDCGYIISGNVNSFVAGGGQNLLLIKTDNNGNTNCSYDVVPVIRDTIPTERLGQAKDSAGFVVQTVISVVNNAATIVSDLCTTVSLISFMSPSDSICKGDSVSLLVQSIDTLASYYNWIPSTGLSNASIANPNVSPDTTTTYTVIVFDSCYTDTAYITIYVKPVPTVFAGNDDTICRGDISILNVSGSGTNYSWSPSTGLNPTTGTIVNASPDSTINYIVTTTANNGCDNSDTIKVTVLQLPILTVTGDTSPCIGVSTTLVISGANTYQWNNGLNTDTITITPTTDVVYSVIGMDTNGCSNTLIIPVTINSLPFINAGPDDTICSGFSTQLSATGTGNFTWSPSSGLNDATIFNPLCTPSNDITYTATLTDANGCSNSDTINIIVKPNATADFTPTPSEGQIPLTVNFVNSSSNANGFEWLFGDSTGSTENSPQHIYTEAGEYTVLLIANNADNCPDTTAYEFIKTEDFSTLWIPNSFTPNNDETNDAFIISGTGITKLEVMIFNRWGELIYEWDSLNGWWDGNYKGSPAEQDVYVYVVKAKGMDNKDYKRIGHVSLIR